MKIFGPKFRAKIADPAKSVDQGPLNSLEDSGVLQIDLMDGNSIKMSKKYAARIESLEPMILMSASAIDIEGTDAGEWISRTDGDNTIFAGGGNDEIYARSGTNHIDGGTGQEHAGYL